ncbi:MAG: hypothetical protein ABWY45_25240 [Mycobacterium sp.]
MADKFEVDVPGLIQGGADVGRRAEMLASAHRQSIVSVGDAQSGWVGSSAQALAAMAGKWEQISAKQAGAIENHAGRMDIAAKLFAEMEERHARQLKTVDEQGRNGAS